MFLVLFLLTGCGDIVKSADEAKERDSKVKILGGSEQCTIRRTVAGDEQFTWLQCYGESWSSSGLSIEKIK